MASQQSRAPRSCVLGVLLALGCSDALTAEGEATGDTAAADAVSMTQDADTRDPPNGAQPPPPDATPPLPACDEGDSDGDGYGSGAGCAGPDCDDDNPVVFPGAAEACNNADDDCDGALDEALGERACGVGACRVLAPVCVAGRPAACTAGAPSAELCNGVDDDCDGVTDEGAGVTRCGVGACERAADCIEGAEAQCTPGPASIEACNGIDDDCDGVVDQGFRARVEWSRYSRLVEQHPGCDGGGQRSGPECNAAMHRLCRAQGCGASGFGPLENSGDDAGVACVAAADVRQVSFGELAAQHAPCDGANQRIGSDCNAAIHRWCAGQGAASGFGPVESGPDFAFVGCTPRYIAEVINTSYTTLAQAHDVCDGSRERIGRNCNAAIHRFCSRSGYVTGFGPVENFGDAATIVCLRP